MASWAAPTGGSHAWAAHEAWLHLLSTHLSRVFPGRTPASAETRQMPPLIPKMPPGTCREGLGSATHTGSQPRRSHGSALYSFQDLKSVLSLPQHPGEFLHPVVYACTAVMLLCLLASVITYLMHQR